jgi:hypothetical protein
LREASRETGSFKDYFLGVQGTNEKLAVITPLISAMFFTVTPEYPNFGSDPPQK